MKKIVLSLLFSALVFFGYSQSGILDPAFGKGGIVASNFGMPYNYLDSGRQILVQGDTALYFIYQVNHATIVSKRHMDGSIDSRYGNKGISVPLPLINVHALLQSDGKILIGATFLTGDYYSGFGYGIYRISANGTLDNSFNKGNILISDYTSYDGFYGSFALDNNGRIVLAWGVDQYEENSGGQVIERYNIDGTLDTSFNGTGKVYINPGKGFGLLVVQPDNKIITGGNFSLQRFNENGTVDINFTVSSVNFTGLYSIATSIALQPDGKILLGGTVYNSYGHNDFVIARFNSNGNPDSSFGINGGQRTAFADSNSVSTSLALQSDGKIILSGYTGRSSVNFAQVRYNTNGNPDSTYGLNSKAITDFGKNDYSNSIAILPGDKLISLGYTTDSATSYIAAARYNTDGSLDNSFNGNGLLTDHLVQGSTQYTCIAVQNDGKIISAGYTWNGSHYNFAVARYNVADGSFDKTFAAAGVQQSGIDTANNQAYAIAVQADGKIVLGGSAGSEAAIVRYNTDGSLDNTFNGNGILKTNLGAGQFITAIVLQPDGKIVVRSLGILARFNMDGSSDNSFTRSALDDNNNLLLASNGLALQRSGKIIASGSYGAESNLLGFNPDGSPDASFGPYAAGVVILGGQQGGGVFVKNIVTDSAGNITISLNTISTDRQNFYGVTLMKYDSLGTQDGSFKTETLTAMSVAASLIQDSSGSLLLGGYKMMYELKDNSVIYKFKKDGSFDSTFAGGGFVITPTSTADNNYQGLALGNGALYASGYGQYPGNFGIVAKYLLASGGALPVALTDFTAILQNKIVLLKWNTASEYNLSHFNIERSAGGSPFNYVGVVAASGNSSIKLSYSAFDPQPMQGVNYYRLRLVDLDGKTSYSKTVAVTLNGNLFSIKIYPDPVGNTLYLHRIGNGEKAIIEITDNTGKHLRTMEMNADNTTVNIDISNLPKGVYTLSVKTASASSVQRFVKE